MIMPVPESWEMATLFSWFRVGDDLLHKKQAGVEEIIPFLCGVSWEEIVSKWLGFGMKITTSHHWGYLVLHSDVCKSLRIIRTLDTPLPNYSLQIWDWTGFSRLVKI